MELSSLSNANPALLALVRSAILADQTKTKESAERRAHEESDLTTRKTSDYTKEISEVTGKTDSTLGNNSSSKSVGTKRLRDGASYALTSPVIAVVKKPKTYVNHSYRDFSKITDLTYSKKTKPEHMSFVEKMHHVLSKKELQSCIGWMPHGRAFRIVVPKTFEQQVCKEYFAMPPRYSSFLRLLNNHGFKQISQGPDRNCYYHECFLRGMPWLCKYMPEPKNARLLIPDPDNEPDFYTLSKLFPLADQAQDKILIPSAAKKHSSSTHLGHSSSSTVVAARLAFAPAAPGSAGETRSALQHPVFSTPALRPSHNKANLMPPNVGLTYSRDLDQLLLVQAAALEDEQARLYGNALLTAAAFRGTLGRNHGNFRCGFPF